MTSQYDDLTLNDLYSLHSQLAADSEAIFNRMVGKDDTGKTVTLISVFSDEWADKTEAMRHIGREMDDVNAAINRREVADISSMDTGCTCDVCLAARDA